MKNSAAVPSGAVAKTRLKGLTKLMSIIFARYLASLTVYVASSQSAPSSCAPLLLDTRGNVKRFASQCPFLFVHNKQLAVTFARLSWIRLVKYDFGLKLTRFPACSPLPIAALPSVSPIPSARLRNADRFLRGVLAVHDSRTRKDEEIL